MTSIRAQAAAVRLPLIAACLVVLGAALLAVRYPEMPQDIAVFRGLSGQPTLTLPKSPAVVFRIAAMGLGQVGATTAMLRSVAAVGGAGWTKFWSSACVAAALKTLVECTQYAMLFRLEPRVWLALSILPVAVFLFTAARLWLSGHCQIPRAPSLVLQLESRLVCPSCSILRLQPFRSGRHIDVRRARGVELDRSLRRNKQLRGAAATIWGFPS